MMLYIYAPVWQYVPPLHIHKICQFILVPLSYLSSYILHIKTFQYSATYL